MNGSEKKTVLVVDDMELNRDILESILEDTYDVVCAADGEEALELVRSRKEPFAIILLDLMMPGMDGLAVLRELNAMDYLLHTPVIIISGDQSVENEKQCFDFGVADFVHKPFDAVLVQVRVRNAVELYEYKNHLEEQVAAQTERLVEQNRTLQEQAEKLRDNNRKVTDLLGAMVEFRNMESGTHVQRVKAYTRIIAMQMMKDYPEYGFTELTVENMADASVLHDVGKIAISDAILLKPGKYTPEEFAAMKTHTTKGGEIIQSMTGVWDKDYSSLCYDICVGHHERYDGRGYPRGISGEDIPIAAQIAGAADVFDALVTPRVYKGAYTPDEAYHMIMNGECGTFSPNILDCITKTRDQFAALALMGEVAGG